MRFRMLNSAPFAALFMVLIPSALICTRPSTGLPVYIARMPAYCGDGSVFVLQLFQDGSLKLNVETVTITGLEDRLREVFKTRAERLLIVKADPGVVFEKVAQIIEIGNRQADYVALFTPSLERELQQRPFCCCLTINRPVK